MATSDSPETEPSSEKESPAKPPLTKEQQLRGALKHALLAMVDEDREVYDALTRTILVCPEVVTLITNVATAVIEERMKDALLKLHVTLPPDVIRAADLRPEAFRFYPLRR